MTFFYHFHAFKQTELAAVALKVEHVDGVIEWRVPIDSQKEYFDVKAELVKVFPQLGPDPRGFVLSSLNLLHTKESQ